MKKLLLFLMVAIPILVILIVKLTASVTGGELYTAVENIVINQEPIEAKVGETMEISYTIYPEIATNKEVVWSIVNEWTIDNEECAVIDMSGRVEFVGVGSGYITATTVDGNKRSQCPFYVWDTKVHKLKINSPQNYLFIGDDLQLNAQVLPNEALNKDVEYSSSDESIATVDTNGIVYGKAKGDVTIYATTVDGAYVEFIDLSVLKPVDFFTLEQQQKEIIMSSPSRKIEFLVEPFDATNSVTFEVDKPEIATVNHLGVITFEKAGEVTVTASTLDGKFTEQVKYIYTGGYAYDLILENMFVNMQVNSAPVHIDYSTVPENLLNTKVEFYSHDEDVAYVDANGFIHAIKGGSTIIDVKVKKSEEEYIEKQVYVNIESPATDIFIEDCMTAEKTLQLEPVSLPEDSTNTDYFYHMENTNLATVSSDGFVIFNSNTPCTAIVTIYANEDYSNVSKQVKITYTAGKVGSFELLDKNITMTYGQVTTLNYKILPTNATIKPFTITISQPDPSGRDVVEILGDGKIRAIGGGKVTVKTLFVLYDNSIVEDYCEITVLRDPEDIEINVDLERYKDQFVTAENTVKFSGKVLPNDATEKEITWSVSDRNIAFIRDDTLIFKTVGTITLTASVKNVSNSVEIYYAGLNPVFAEVCAIKDGETISIPEKIAVGESFDVVISKLLPTYKTNPAFSLEAENQNTVADLGRVLQISENKVTGVAGGTATLAVYISNSIRLKFEIEVIRKPEKISVLQADSQVTTQEVTLVSEVLPYDTTNQEVYYVTADSDIAYIEGNVLVFRKNGIAHITAFCRADERVRLDFYIEKIEKNMIYVALSEKEVVANKGDLIAFETSNSLEYKIEENSAIVEGENVLTIEDKYIRATAAGKAKLLIVSGEQSYEINFTVNQLVENITFKTNADVYNDEFVFGNYFIDLNFDILPSYAVNKDYTISVIRSVSYDGKNENIAYITGGKVYFTKAGSITIQVNSNDGNCSKVFRLRYTGGDALDAQLNVDELLVLNLGDSVTIDVSKWVPFDATNTRISIYEINSSGKKIIEINEKTKTIVAIDSGETKVVVELSNGITKEIQIICVNKVTEILADDNVLISADDYVINATVLPKDATNRNLEYLLEETDVALIEGNRLHFLKAGTVFVTIKTTDGSGIEKTISITSTKGYLSKIEVNSTDIHLKKGDRFKIVVNKFPLDAQNGDVQFKILSQNAHDGNSQVINLLEDGQIVALSCGSATIRVFAFDYYGEEIFVDCNVNVYSPLTDFDIKFENPLDTYQNANSFITSKKELHFQMIQNPTDAAINSFNYKISGSNLAKIEGNKIIFLDKGRVTITFTCVDNLLIEKSKTYSFYYVGDDLIEATLDKANFENNVLSLDAGEEFTFKLAKALPSDNENLNFTIQNVVEKRNDKTKAVAEFKGGTLHALNGGTYSFTLFVNGLKLDNITVVVFRDAVGIEIDGDEEAYVSVPFYTISAHVVESDSHQNVLGFKTSSNIATVDKNGYVTFNQFGTCEVTVFVKENPSIFKVVKITYTKQLQAIEFNKTKEKMYVGEYINLTVFAKPLNAESFTYTMEIDNQSVAQLIKREDGYRLLGLSNGEVTVTAKVDGKDISVSKTFKIYEKITDIKLELDPSGDTNGHGEYRVFGNFFFNEKNEIVNYYKMKVSLIPTVPAELLDWTSSSQEIAMVDNSGVVTFLSTGKVTISIKQKAPYEGANVETDSYQFTVVEGLNVYSYEQYKIAHGWLKARNENRQDNYAYLVLHNDIAIAADFGEVVFDYNIMGNGKMLDHSAFNNGWSHYFIYRNNIILDNVILRGANFKDNVQLKGTGNILIMANCSGIYLYNTIFENAESGVRAENVRAIFEGCIFRNCFLVDLKVGRNANGVSTIKLKDCIFATSAVGIMYIMDTDPNPAQSIVSLEGDVYFYNWATLEQLQQTYSQELEKKLKEIGVSFVMSEIAKQVKQIAENNGKDYVYRLNGKSYYNFASVRLEADILSKTYAGNGLIERSKLNPECNYSQKSFSGAVNLLHAVTVPVRCSLLSILADKAFIKPGDTYIGNERLLSKIKKGCRF